MAAAYQQVEPPKDPGCYVKPLPERLYVEAAKTAKAINPANDPFAVQPDNSLKEVLAPQHIALLTSKVRVTAIWCQWRCTGSWGGVTLRRMYIANTGMSGSSPVCSCSC